MSSSSSSHRSVSPNVQCTMYTEYYTVYTIQCIVYNVQSTMYKQPRPTFQLLAHIARTSLFHEWFREFHLCVCVCFVCPMCDSGKTYRQYIRQSAIRFIHQRESRQSVDNKKKKAAVQPKSVNNKTSAKQYLALGTDFAPDFTEGNLMRMIHFSLHLYSVLYTVISTFVQKSV